MRGASKLLAAAAVAVTIAVPLAAWPGLVSPFSTPKIALLAAWVIGASIFLVSRGLDQIRVESRLQKLGVAWIALVSASALWGVTASPSDLLIGLLPPAWFLLVTWLKPDPRPLVSGLIIAGLVIAAIAIAQYLGHDLFRSIGWQAEAHGSTRMRVFATLGNPNFVAAFLACILPLAWVTNLLKLPLSVLLILAGIITTGSRAPVLGGAAFLILAAWSARSISARTRVLVLISITFVGGLVVCLSVGRPLAEVLEGRLFVWRAALNQASARTLILGDGPGSFALNYPKWETAWAASRPGDERSLRFLGYQDHAHNDWLEVLLEQGIAGVAVLALIPIAALRMFGRRHLRPKHPGDGAVAGIAIFVGVACVDFPFHRPAGSFAFWTLLAIVHLSFFTHSEAVDSTRGVPVEAVTTGRGGVS